MGSANAAAHQKVTKAKESRLIVTLIFGDQLGRRRAAHREKPQQLLAARIEEVSFAAGLVALATNRDAIAASFIFHDDRARPKEIALRFRLPRLPRLR